MTILNKYKILVNKKHIENILYIKKFYYSLKMIQCYAQRKNIKKYAK